jgi:L-ascorbate metabolism protein UlaG (beta-lactamase superfamily)
MATDSSSLFKAGKPSRRSVLTGLGLGTAGVAAAAAYSVSPFFWRMWAQGLGRDVAPAPLRPQPGAWPDTGLHAAWLGHATLLLKLDGFTVLTDPVFSRRIGLGLGPLVLGFKRLVDPALALAELPRIDLVLLSHAHMDHFDLPTLAALEPRRLPVVTARGTSDLLRVERHGPVTELGWREHAQVGPLRLTGLEVNHWGARMRRDTWRGYNGYLLECGRWRVVFGGDTAATPYFCEVGGADLAVMPIGAYDPWIRVHCSPEQAWRMAEDARAAHILPMHHRTFRLSYEPVEEPAERLLRAAGRSPDRVALTSIGDEFHLA